MKESRIIAHCATYNIEDIITPHHLIFGDSILNRNLKDEIQQEDNCTLTKRLQHLQTVLTHTKKRWRHEYLTELREYHKDRKYPNSTVKVGDVVLVEDCKLPRIRWKMGVVVELIESNDGLIRGCKLKISKRGKINFISRPINQLYYFEIDSNSSNTEKENDVIEHDANDEKNEIQIPNQRVKRNAAIVGELRRKFQS